MLIDLIFAAIHRCYQSTVIMSINLQILMGTSLLIVALVDSQRPPLAWNFKKEITVHGKVIIPGSPMPSDNGSFMYAVCDNRNSLSSFIESRCNITLDKPILPWVTRKLSCPIHIMPDNLEGTESLAQLSLSLLGDDKAVLTWLQRSRGASMAKLKLVRMRTCQVLDVPIPVERIRFVVSYGNGLDVVLHSKTYCSSPVCKVSLNADGQIVSEPTEVLLAEQRSDMYAALGPVVDGAIDKGFFLANRFTGDRSRLFRIAADGVGAEVTTFSVDRPFGFSTANGYLSLCDSFTDTIACRSYDAALELPMSRTVEFHDKGAARWLQPYNLRDGAVLLVTGRVGGEKAQRFEHFSVYRLDAGGKKHRKRLEVENLNFSCESARALRVRVVESALDDEICFYFSCVHKEADRSMFQFAYKCYPKLYFEAMVPLTNGCFLAKVNETITDFTIYA